MNKNYIYIIFSATPSRIGKAIRFFTKEKYNHVSVAMDADMEDTFTFARRNYYTPFWGGFVRESLSRFHIGEKKSDICICKLPVTQQRYKHTEALIHKMDEKQEDYLYNHLSIFGACIRKRIHVKDACTCVEFCAQILEGLGFPVSQKAYYTVGDLEKLLAPYIVYSGPISDPTSTDTHYFFKLSPLKRAFYTCRDMLRLFPRLVHK